MCNPVHFRAVSVLTLSLAWSVQCFGQPISLFEPADVQASLSQQAMPPQVTPRDPQVTPRDIEELDQSTSEIPANLRRQVVPYLTREAPRTIVIDTPHTSLYYVL